MTRPMFWLCRLALDCRAPFLNGASLTGSTPRSVVSGLAALRSVSLPRNAAVQQPKSAVDEVAKAAAGDDFLLRRRFAPLGEV
jgi:hypothetical protein